MGRLAGRPPRLRRQRGPGARQRDGPGAVAYALPDRRPDLVELAAVRARLRLSRCHPAGASRRRRRIRTAPAGGHRLRRGPRPPARRDAEHLPGTFVARRRVRPRPQGRGADARGHRPAARPAVARGQGGQPAERRRADPAAQRHRGPVPRQARGGRADLAPLAQPSPGGVHLGQHRGAARGEPVRPQRLVRRLRSQALDERAAAAELLQPQPLHVGQQPRRDHPRQHLPARRLVWGAGALGRVHRGQRLHRQQRGGAFRGGRPGRLGAGRELHAVPGQPDHLGRPQAGVPEGGGAVDGGGRRGSAVGADRQHHRPSGRPGEPGRAGGQDGGAPAAEPEPRARLRRHDHPRLGTGQRSGDGGPRPGAAGRDDDPALCGRGARQARGEHRRSCHPSAGAGGRKARPHGRRGPDQRLLPRGVRAGHDAAGCGGNAGVHAGRARRRGALGQPAELVHGRPAGDTGRRPGGPCGQRGLVRGPDGDGVGALVRGLRAADGAVGSAGDRRSGLGGRHRCGAFDRPVRAGVARRLPRRRPAGD